MGLLQGFLAIFLIYISAAAQACEVPRLIGWIHNTPAESQKSADVLVQAAARAQNKKCAEAGELIQAHLKVSESRLGESLRVMAELKQSSATRMGLEYAPDEQNNFFSALGANLKVLSTFCPSLETQKLTALLDPAYAYSQLNESTLLPLENAEIKKKLTRGIASETLNYNPDFETLTPAARDLLLAANKKNRLGESLSTAEREKVISAEKNPAQKEKLSRVLTELIRIQELNTARNRAMAQNSRGQKNLVILVGQSHVAGLRAEFNRLCR